jgi:hypothetical protein
VKIYRRLTSIVLLFFLGAVLGAEAVGFSDFHNSARAEYNYDINHEHDHASDSASHCSDPCHTGQSHFGHSLYNTAELRVQFLLDSSTEVKNSRSQSALQGPVLEGRRKPPRFS